MTTQGKGPIVVAGAGLAGLSAAVRLSSQKTERDIVVLEATASGGGRSRSFDHSRSGYELDNGQHLMMGCYFETLAFLRTLGQDHNVEFQRNMSVDMVQPGGKRVSMRCPALPAPLHLGAGLLGMRGMGLLHKVSALRAGLLLRGEVDRPDDNETCDAWLRRLGQTQAIRNAFWEPLVWATLNDDPLVSSAAMLMAVLERAFLGTRDASSFGLPKVPLSKLYVDPSTQYLKARGVSVRTASPVRGIECGSSGVQAVILRNGERIETDTVISALPPKPLLSALPDAVLRDPVFTDVAKLTNSPIVNLWVVLDRALWDDVPFLGLISSPLHWLFDRSRIEGLDEPGRVLVNCTISGARGMVDDRPHVLVELFKAEMKRFFPGRSFEVLDSKVIKEKKATITHAAGTYQFRPGTVSPVKGLFLAGDWVRTGLPATIESAVQSGHDAAKAVRARG